MLQHTAYNPFDTLAQALKTDFPDQTDAARNTFFLDGDTTVLTKDSSVSITQAWSGTKLAPGSAVDTPAVKTPAQKYADMGIVLLLIVFFLVATGRIIEGLGRAFWASLLMKRQIEVDDDLLAPEFEPGQHVAAA